MKRLLLVVLALAMVCCGFATGAYDFQSPSQMAAFNVSNRTLYCGAGDYQKYVYNENGGNSRFYVGSGEIRNLNPQTTQYWAATFTKGSSGFLLVNYLDASKTSMGSTTFLTIPGWYPVAWTNPTRAEVFISGGTAYAYLNGAFQSNTTPMAQNPSYIQVSYSYYSGCGNIYMDDWTYGETTTQYVIGAPEDGLYYIKKDMVTPSSSGFYARNASDTLINSNTFTSTFGKSNTSSNETIDMLNMDTGTIYDTKYTGLSLSNITTWNFATSLIAAGAPYGKYGFRINGTYADEYIWYLGSGATISFDKDTYSGEDTATLTYSILGAYWDTSTYDYSIDVVSGTTGATLNVEAISASSGTSEYTFTTTDPLGVYYGIVKATKRSDGSVIWMNYDYAELTSYVTTTGYVNDAETGLPISGANVNITQSSIINNLTTIADGNYSATYYQSGAPITINATAPLHRQYTFTFTPLIAKTYNINLSLVNLTPVVSPIGIVGVVRDTAYGQPIPAAIVDGVNATAQVTNTSIPITGFYRLNSGTLLNESDYDVHGSKAGYSNSSTDSVNINGSVSNYTYNDVWLAGQYLQTFYITDSGTLAPITNVTIVSSSGKTYVTTNGTGYLTEPFGLYTVTFSSTGYSPRTITYVFDADESHAVALTPAEDSTNAFNTWYTPWQVRIRIVDLYGKPLPETSVSASYIATTLPSTDPTWLVGAYGVSDAVAADMLNSSMAI
jgi:hypothetical protein